MKALIRLSLFVFIALSLQTAKAQNSAAHVWIEANLEAVRNDFAKPVVHARNLFHTSVAMYDAWAAYDSIADTYFLGKDLGNYTCAYTGVPEPISIEYAQRQAVSYAAYRMLKHRYATSPNNASIYFMLDTTMLSLGFNGNYTNTDYTTGGPGALGNYIAQELIAATQADGANEAGGYENQHYLPVNEELVIDEAHFIGNPDMDSLNRWQPLGLTLFCDQSGNSFVLSPEFLGAEWGNVLPFALNDSVKTQHTRDGDPYIWNVYHDPGPPPLIAEDGGADTEHFRWGMDLVAKWSSFLDPADPALIDISPASLGNIPLSSLPTDFTEYDQFYNRDTGGDIGVGYPVNPSTGMPYASQVVKRGDYGRILAEFWADGPDSETPPGHWFAIYNEISQYPEFTWKWQGQGAPLSQMEYDIKTYFTLGGAMHDAAIAAWSVKGYYDYVRPVSALRAMAERGQSSDPLASNYHPAGLELEPGHIELVQLGDTIYEGDTILVAGLEHVDMLKLKCWIGPLAEDTCITGFAPDYQSEVAGVGWKFALDFWPYQRPTFVTPPFAGYVSGHSTFSRAAAEVLTMTTGDAYFPGGMGEFHCPQDEYLVFEDGPSIDITLQWATYQDASDQCSLSRIYGGIHPPADDIPGRLMGYEVGQNTYTLAERYFNGGVPEVAAISVSNQVLTDANVGQNFSVNISYNKRMDTSMNPNVSVLNSALQYSNETFTWLTDSVCQWTVTLSDHQARHELVQIEISGARSYYAQDVLTTAVSTASELFIDMENPTVSSTTDNSSSTTAEVLVNFSEAMDVSSMPSFTFPDVDPTLNGLTLDVNESTWVTDQQYVFVYTIQAGTELSDIAAEVQNAHDSVGNPLADDAVTIGFRIDTQAPSIVTTVATPEILTSADVGTSALSILVSYDELMDHTSAPVIVFDADQAQTNSLAINAAMSGWVSDNEYEFVYDLLAADETLMDIDISLSTAQDTMGLTQVSAEFLDLFVIDTEAPTVVNTSTNNWQVVAAEVAEEWTCTFNFSEAMDTAVLPVISFPNETPGLSLVLTGGAWSGDGLAYTASAEIGDTGEDLENIDVMIAGVQDVLGNPIAQAYTATDLVSIELSLPAVTNHSIDNQNINETAEGTTLSLSISFDKEMDSNVAPTIAWSGADVSSSFILQAASWTDLMTYDLQYTIMDSDLEASGLALSVSGAADLVGNVQEEASIDDILNVDMLSPEVSDAVPSVPIIDNALIDGVFSITVNFSEALDQTSIPSLSFPVEDPTSALAFDFVTSTWLDESSYRYDFQVASVIFVLSDVDVAIDGAIDLMGNPMSSIVIEDLFDMDLASSLDDMTVEHAVLIYPNPVQIGQDLLLSNQGQGVISTIQLLDMKGSMVRSYNSASLQNEIIRLSTQGLTDGQYLLSVMVDGQETTQRVILRD